MEAISGTPRRDCEILVHYRSRRGQPILFHLQHTEFTFPRFTQDAYCRHHGLLQHSRHDLSDPRHRHSAQTASEGSRGTQGRSLCRLRGIRTTQTDRCPEMGYRLLCLFFIQGNVLVDAGVQDEVDVVYSCTACITRRFIFVLLPSSRRSSRWPITFSQYTTAHRRSRSAVQVMNSFTAPAGSFRISYRSHRKASWKRPLLQLRNTSKASCDLCCPSSRKSSNTIEVFA